MEFYARDREEWRKWLEENHSVIQGIWLVYYKKTSGRSRISYNDAVEEALCFGWIDGKIKRVDEDHYIQWFTPRRRGSRWSELNLSRAKKLIESGLMKPAGMIEYEKAHKKPERIYNTKKDENLVMPEDLIIALKNNESSYNNFINFPPSSRKLYIFWLNDAKRAETRKSRIARIVDQSAKNMKPGF